MLLKFIITSLITLLLTFPAGIIHSAENISMTHGPYLLQPTDTSVIVTWFTNRNCVSHIEYGSDNSTAMTGVISRHGLIDANSTCHAIELTGLTPGTEYTYRAVSKEILNFKPYKVTYGDSVISGTFKFTTLDSAKQVCSFVLFQDIHGHAARLDSMLTNIDFDDIDLVFFNGDSIDHFEDESQIFDGLLDVAVNRFASETPIVFVRGNHETRGVKARSLETYFPLRTGEYFYSFDEGPVHFIILDSGEDKPDSSGEYSGLVAFDPYIDMQTKWLADEVKSEAFRSAKYRILVVHIPPIGGNNWYREQYLRREWLPIFNEADVDLVLCGHTHKMAWLEPGSNTNTFPLMTVSPENFTRISADATKIHISVLDTQGNEVMLKVVNTSGH